MHENDNQRPIWHLPPSEDLPQLAGGTLYLVATPIGNLEDITLRALRTLAGADLVLCEDTRHSGRLLKAYGIKNALMSLHRFNERSRTASINERLAAGEVLALISDAGTPGISDPGMRVVQAVWEAGFRVEAVPGACAAIVGLSASGLPTQEFHFVGFLPVKRGQRAACLARLAAIDSTLVLYESPHRIARLMAEMEEGFTGREIVVGRELTKRFEEFLRGNAAELRERLQAKKPRGEFVVVVGPPGP